jgi:hypothetical protein
MAALIFRQQINRRIPEAAGTKCLSKRAASVRIFPAMATLFF